VIVLGRATRDLFCTLVCSPLGRTLGYVFSVLISGVLCSALVAELFKDGRIAWETITHTSSFYLLLAYFFVAWRYYAFLYASETELSPVYRFWSDSLASHFFTISENEKNKLMNEYAEVWSYEGIAW